MSKKFYYLIESLDIDGDKNPDGFLITKYKINKKNNDKIFLVSKYVTFKNFKNKYKKLLKTIKKGGEVHQQQHYQQFPPNYYNGAEYNKYMNNNPYYNQHQPQVMVAYKQPSMGNAFMEGLGGGLGAGFGLGIMNELFEAF